MTEFRRQFEKMIKLLSRFEGDRISKILQHLVLITLLIDHSVYALIMNAKRITSKKIETGFCNIDLPHCTRNKVFYNKDFFRKCDQNRRKSDQINGKITTITKITYSRVRSGFFVCFHFCNSFFTFLRGHSDVHQEFVFVKMEPRLI